jgi:Na+-translocating ferredoxin:NAD+ oxidoreductase RnfC subunit
MCRSCWRGHAYCSTTCRNAQRIQQLRAARLRWDQSPTGQENHRDRSKRYRARQVPNHHHHQQQQQQEQLLEDSTVGDRVPVGSTVTDQPSEPAAAAVADEGAESAPPIPLKREVTDGDERQIIRPRCAWCGRPIRLGPPPAGWWREQARGPPA